MYAVTCEEEASVPLPEGLALVEDFVSPEEEALLLAAVDWSHTNDDVTGEGVVLSYKAVIYAAEMRNTSNRSFGCFAN